VGHPRNNPILQKYQHVGARRREILIPSRRCKRRAATPRLVENGLKAADFAWNAFVLARRWISPGGAGQDSGSHTTRMR
jgi:hypothetical protein